MAVLSAECEVPRPWSVENYPTGIEQVACYLTFLAFVPACCGCVTSSETNAYLDQRSNTTGKFFAEMLGGPIGHLQHIPQGHLAKSGRRLRNWRQSEKGNGNEVSHDFKSIQVVVERRVSRAICVARVGWLMTKTWCKSFPTTTFRVLALVEGIDMELPRLLL